MERRAEEQQETLMEEAERKHAHGTHLTESELGKLELRVYRIQNATWLFLGMAAITSCLTFFLDATTRKESAVGLKLDPTYQQIWNVSWGIGGFLIIIGVFWWISRVEVIGHILFGGAIFTEAIAIFVAFGHFVPSMLTLLGFTLASFFRGYWILRILPKRRHGSP